LPHQAGWYRSGVAHEKTIAQLLFWTLITYYFSPI